MTDTDPYTGIRTRDNIVEPNLDDDIGQRSLHAIRTRAHATLRERLEADHSPPLVYHPPPSPLAEPSAYEQNLVPAEDLPAHETIAQLKQQIVDMHADWVKLNEFYNTTAQKREWCSDYEERLQHYNEHFTVLRLVGRPRNWYGSTSTWKTINGEGYGDNG